MSSFFEVVTQVNIGKHTCFGFQGLEKAIKAKIESDVTQAASKEAKPFRVVKPSAADEDNQKGADKSKKKGQGKTSK